MKIRSKDLAGGELTRWLASITQDNLGNHSAKIMNRLVTKLKTIPTGYFLGKFHTFPLMEFAYTLAKSLSKISTGIKGKCSSSTSCLMMSFKSARMNCTSRDSAPTHIACGLSLKINSRNSVISFS